MEGPIGGPPVPKGPSNIPLVGHSNETKVLVKGYHTDSLLDSGSMVTSLLILSFRLLEPCPDISTTCESVTSPSPNSTDNTSFSGKDLTVSDGKYVIPARRNGSSVLRLEAPPFHPRRTSRKKEKPRWMSEGSSSTDFNSDVYPISVLKLLSH